MNIIQPLVCATFCFVVTGVFRMFHITCYRIVVLLSLKLLWQFEEGKALDLLMLKTL